MAWRDLIVSSQPHLIVSPSKVSARDSAPSRSYQPAAQVAPPTDPLPLAPPAQVPAKTIGPQGPTAPLQPGWLVSYHSLTPVQYGWQTVYPLVGGCDDRARGTVTTCDWDGVTSSLSIHSNVQVIIANKPQVAAPESKPQ